MSVRPIPEGFHTITPNIIVQGAEKAVEFYKKAFGAEEKLRLTMPDGKIAHPWGRSKRRKVQSP
jgi:PhnB protein